MAQPAPSQHACLAYAMAPRTCGFRYHLYVSCLEAHLPSPCSHPASVNKLVKNCVGVIIASFKDVLVLLRHRNLAATTATHSKLLDCNAKANKATVLKPQLGKLAPCSSVSFTARTCASVSKNKME
eukprot:1318585-Amphidinium_carterae.1